MTETPRLLCYVPYGAWLVHNQLDCMLGAALHIRGAEVELMTCDGMFQEECYVLAHSKNPVEECRMCSEKGKKFFGIFPLPLKQLRSFIQEDDWNEIEGWLQASNIPDFSRAEYKGLPLGDWVRTSVRSYHVVNPRSIGLPHVQALFRRYIKYSWVTYRAAGRFFDQFKPTHLSMFGGYGFLHAPLMQLAAERGCKMITHERGQTPSSFMVASDDPVDTPEALAPLLKAWGDVPLSEEEFSQVNTVFKDWEQGKNRILAAFYKQGSEASQVRAHLGIPNEARILSVFTSGEHELYTEHQRRVVGKQIDVIGNLINLFRTREEYLVIRHHPNIGIGVRAKQDYDYLTRAYEQMSDLPPNVRVVMPNEQMTSYAILWNSAASISFASTVAVEAVARGVSSAALALSMFSGVATHIVSDFSMLGLTLLTEQLFDKSGHNFTVEELRKAYTFIRAYVTKFSTQFRSFGIKNTHEMDIRVTSLDQLAPSMDPTLDRLCNYVMKGTSIYDMPTEAERSRSKDVEAKLLKNELESIRAHQLKVKEESKTVSPPSGTTLVLMISDGSSGFDLFKRSNLYNQRLAAVEQQVLPRSPDLFSHLKKAAELSNSRYVLVTNAGFIYDESFLRTGALALEEKPEHRAVLFPSWVYEKGRMVHYLFTSHNPINSVGELSSQLGREIKPDDLFGFALFKRETFISMCSEAPTVDQLFSILRSPGTVQHQGPAVRVSRT